MALPRSASLALWLNAALDGRVGPDELADAVRDEDPRHLVVDWPDRPEPFGLEALPAAARALGVRRVTLALPVPGDLTGLGGPAGFNQAAVDLGEAVVVDADTPVGLLPELDARTVVWHASPADPAPVLDPFEEGRLLRQVLLTATAELVRLDVAGWQPEIPDLLLNLDKRPALPLPPGTPPAALDALERAELCREIVGLARLDDGGAITAAEAGARARCLTDLDVAARRTLVAFCSASLSAS